MPTPHHQEEPQTPRHQLSSDTVLALQTNFYNKTTWRYEKMTIPGPNNNSYVSYNHLPPIPSFSPTLSPSRCWTIILLSIVITVLLSCRTAPHYQVMGSGRARQKFITNPAVRTLISTIDIVHTRREDQILGERLFRGLVLSLYPSVV